ncbi:uncharacterized protein LAESUDRAFT_715979 [Laetiporus sulphureus 93-53]|uniref:Uncharacterized protein n=1 Tax=Laetiporus sulphureus 93-53 TaxID=1314785 RepID=A0A165CZQ5_9APHY|nr:uncharacterized protein LAESUDRAFT_715979 [Laetiporus sulphureus 93-53]KZT03836.1 hypothetical protein LAESUDRAFT_715979 [Laetiporus sulphureus 93-53]
MRLRNRSIHRLLKQLTEVQGSDDLRAGLIRCGKLLPPTSASALLTAYCLRLAVKLNVQQTPWGERSRQSMKRSAAGQKQTRKSSRAQRTLHPSAQMLKNEQDPAPHDEGSPGQDDGSSPQPDPLTSDESTVIQRSVDPSRNFHHENRDMRTSPRPPSLTPTARMLQGKLDNQQKLVLQQQTETAGGLQSPTLSCGQLPASLPATSDIPARHKTIQKGRYSVVETGSSARLSVTTENFPADNGFSQAAASLVSPNIHATGHLSRSPSRGLPQKSDSRPSMRAGLKGLMPIMEDPCAESVVTAGQRRGTPFRSVDQVSSKADVRAQYGSNPDGPAPEGRVADTEWNSYDDDNDDDGDGGDNATILKEFELIDSSFQAVAKCLNISLGDVLARYDTYRLDSEEEQLAYKLYEGYYSEHVMEESSRVPAATNDNESNDADHIYNCWRQFRRTHPMTWPSIIKLEDRMSDIAIDGNAPQEREHLSNYFTQRLTSLLNALAENHGLHSVLIMAGNNIVKDGGIGMAYESSESEGFLRKLTHASTDEAIGHLKAHVWHNHSTARIIMSSTLIHNDFASDCVNMGADTGAPLIAPTEHVDWLSDVSAKGKHAALSEIEGTFEELLRTNGMTEKYRGSKHLLPTLFDLGLACFNWPDDVPWTILYDDNAGLAGLDHTQVDRLYFALIEAPPEDRIHVDKHSSIGDKGPAHNGSLVLQGVDTARKGRPCLKVFIARREDHEAVYTSTHQADNSASEHNCASVLYRGAKREAQIDDQVGPSKRIRTAANSSTGVSGVHDPSDLNKGLKDGTGRRSAVGWRQGDEGSRATSGPESSEAQAKHEHEAEGTVARSSHDPIVLNSEVARTQSKGKRRQIEEGSKTTSGLGSFEAQAKHEAEVIHSDLERTGSARKRRQVDEGSHTTSGETRAHHNVSTLKIHVQPPTPAKPLAAASSEISKSLASQQSIGASRGAAITERAPSGSTQSAGRDAQAIQEDVKDRNDSSELSRPSYVHPIGSVHYGTEHYADDRSGSHGILGTSTGNIISTPHMPITTAGHAEAAVHLPDNSRHDTVFNTGTPYANVATLMQPELGRSYVRYPQEVLDLAEQVWVLKNSGAIGAMARRTTSEHRSSVSNAFDVTYGRAERTLVPVMSCIDVHLLRYLAHYLTDRTLYTTLRQFLRPQADGPIGSTVPQGANHTAAGKAGGGQGNVTGW